MGIASGSVSISRYKILGIAANAKLNALNQGMMPLQVKRLKLQGSTKELSWGWDRPSMLALEAIDGDAHWDLSDCQVDGGFLLSIRIDRRKVPTKLLQMIAKERLHKKQSRREKPMSAKERKQLWAETKDELISLALPDLQFIECFWNLETQEVLLFSTGKKIQAIFEELFYKSFCQGNDGQIVKIDPPLMGLGQDEWHDEKTATIKLARLTQTVPMSLHD